MVQLFRDGVYAIPVPNGILVQVKVIKVSFLYNNNTLHKPLMRDFSFPSSWPIQQYVTGHELMLKPLKFLSLTHFENGENYLYTV